MCEKVVTISPHVSTSKQENTKPRELEQENTEPRDLEQENTEPRELEQEKWELEYRCLKTNTLTKVQINFP